MFASVWIRSDLFQHFQMHLTFDESICYQARSKHTSKKRGIWGYYPCQFFGFSAKFQAQNAILGDFRSFLGQFFAILGNFRQFQAIFMSNFPPIFFAKKAISATSLAFWIYAPKMFHQMYVGSLDRRSTITRCPVLPKKCIFSASSQ